MVELSNIFIKFAMSIGGLTDIINKERLLLLVLENVGNFRRCKENKRISRYSVDCYFPSSSSGFLRPSNKVGESVHVLYLLSRLGLSLAISKFFMKKTVFLAAIAIVSMSPVIYASSSQPAESQSCVSASLPVCQFSLSDYSGTVSNGTTGYFTVNLSCPQNEDIYATVTVYIDNEPVASQVVKVAAGCTRSNSICISVGRSYDDQYYKLSVE